MGNTRAILIEDVRRTVDFLFPGDDVFELCTFDRYKKPLAGWYRDKQKAIDEVQKISRDATLKAIYLTLNPCHDALLSRSNERINSVKSRTQDVDILSINHLYIDVDPKRPGDTNSSDAEHELAIKKMHNIRRDLSEQGWSEPLCGDSGNGGMLVYRIEQQPNTKETVTLIQNCLKALAAEYDDGRIGVDQAVFNPARIVKLLGTMTRKGDSTPDRPQRLSKALSIPEDPGAVTLEQLKELANAVSNEERQQPEDKGSCKLDVPAYLNHYGVELSREKTHGDSTLYCLGECVFNPDHTQNEAAIVKGRDGVLTYQCFHNSCKGKTWHEARGSISGNDKLTQFLRGNNTGKQKMEDEKVTEVNEVNATDKKVIQVKPFPFDIFPKAMLETINVVSESFSVQPSLVASIMLAITSGAIGNSIKVSVKSGYEVNLFLWLMVIGKTGYGKTPPMDFLMQPVDKRQAENSTKNEELTQAYFRQMRSIKNGATAEVPDKPKLSHNLVSDITVESLADVFHNDNRGVISHQDELAGFMLGMDQYKSKGNDLQHYLKLFYGRSWKIDRKGVSKFIPNTGLALIGGIQTEIVPKIFETTAIKNGLFPRFITENVEGSPGKFQKGGIARNVVDTWTKLINDCYSIPIKHGEHGFVEPHLLTIAEAALEEWIIFHDEWATVIPFMSSRLSPFVEKLKGYCSLKFAGILHVLKCFLNKTSLEEKIDTETMAGAIALTRYFAGQAMLTLNLYDVSKRLTEFEVRLIRILHQLWKGAEVKNGRLLFSRIVETFNSGLPEMLRHKPERISGLLKELGLKTEKGGMNIVYLVWELSRLEGLFSRITITTITTITTEDDNNRNVTDVTDVIVESEKRNPRIKGKLI